MNFGHLTRSITNNNCGQYYDKCPQQHTNEILALKQVTLYIACAMTKNNYQTCQFVQAAILTLSFKFSTIFFIDGKCINVVKRWGR